VVLGWRQAYLSQHLMALRKAGLIDGRREGRYIHYRLANPNLLDLVRRAAGLQGLALPDLGPSPDCGCSNCCREKAGDER
jgi:ArsR family transcriptional regulator